jgi:outer membrane protein assembly factor BamB
MNLIILILSVFTQINSGQHDINASPEWRGINRSGHYNENGLLKSWPADGPQLLWETNTLGSGFGSPLITSDRLFVAGSSDSTAYLFSFDLNGKLQYRTVIGKEWISHFPGARSTPVVAGNQVYIMTGTGDFSCVNKITGKVLWQKNMVKDFEGVSPMFGFVESPLINGDKVYCTPGGKEYNVVALNRFTGGLIWSCKGKGEYPAYNSPALFTSGGRKIIADFSTYHLMAIDAETGELLWTDEQTNIPPEKRALGEGDTHANTVLVENNILYYFAGDGNRAVALQLSDDGKKITRLWNNQSVDNYMGGIVKEDSSIFSNGFSKHKLLRLNAVTGAITDSLSIGRGTLILADNMLYYYNDKGEVHLVSYQNGPMKDISSFKITKGGHEHFSHPVISNGVLYIRHGEYLGAWKIRQ